ncbi:MAG: hypothetical protein ACOY99_06100 [Pseudomonadota bacterium]
MTLIRAALVSATLVAMGSAVFSTARAQTSDQSHQQGEAHMSGAGMSHDDIYGADMMSEAERLAYRERMRAAKSEEERAQIRTEHYAAMQERARERGIDMPAAPMAHGAMDRGTMGQGMDNKLGDMRPQDRGQTQKMDRMDKPSKPDKAGRHGGGF